MLVTFFQEIETSIAFLHSSHFGYDATLAYFSPPSSLCIEPDRVVGFPEAVRKELCWILPLAWKLGCLVPRRYAGFEVEHDTFRLQHRHATG